LTALTAITAILVIGSVALAILANWDLYRQKKEVAQLQQAWREIAARLEQEEERHRLSQGTLEFTEKLKGETEDSIVEMSSEIERLEEEEQKAESEGLVEDGEQTHQEDPHAIKMARDPRREVI
jgi:hypothetical protein